MLNSTLCSFITKFMHNSFKYRPYNNKSTSIILIVFQNPIKQMLLLRNGIHVFIFSPAPPTVCAYLFTLRHYDYNCCFIAFYFAAIQIDSGSNVNLMNYAPIILPLYEVLMFSSSVIYSWSIRCEIHLCTSMRAT